MEPLTFWLEDDPSATAAHEYHLNLESHLGRVVLSFPSIVKIIVKMDRFDSKVGDS